MILPFSPKADEPLLTLLLPASHEPMLVRVWRNGSSCTHDGPCVHHQIDETHSVCVAYKDSESLALRASS